MSLAVPRNKIINLNHGRIKNKWHPADECTQSNDFRQKTTATKEATYNAGASVNSGFWGAVEAAKKVEKPFVFRL